MARRFILSDDFTGEESEDVTNHLFMLDNVFYEVDFSAASFEQMELALAPFLKVMRETRRITATARGDASQAEVIRQWAKANGMEVAERGRLSEEIVKAYDSAHSNAESTTANEGETDSPNPDETGQNDGNSEAISELPKDAPTGSNRNKRQ